jgi:hypothetical protein
VSFDESLFFSMVWLIGSISTFPTDGPGTRAGIFTQMKSFGPTSYPKMIAWAALITIHLGPTAFDHIDPNQLTRSIKLSRKNPKTPLDYLDLFIHPAVLCP